MTRTEIECIMNIFDENDLSCFTLNSQSSLIRIADDLDDEILYNELDTLNEELSKSGLNFKIEENYLMLF